MYQVIAQNSEMKMNKIKKKERKEKYINTNPFK